MTAVQHRARLHERSVQAIARGEVSRARRGRGPVRTRRVLDSRRTKVDPLIWKLVHDLGVDRRHVEILNDRQIVIWNNSGPWPSTPSVT